MWPRGGLDPPYHLLATARKIEVARRKPNIVPIGTSKKLFYFHVVGLIAVAAQSIIVLLYTEAYAMVVAPFLVYLFVAPLAGLSFQGGSPSGR